jgi:hypothetical protein
VTKREAMDLTAQENRLMSLGITRTDSDTLRRISMTLRRWFERECGIDNGCIERDETTNKAYWLNSISMRRYPIADRETGARKRLAMLMSRYPTLTAYVQGDPRGCALYILTAEQLASKHEIDSIYTRGVAVS